MSGEKKKKREREKERKKERNKKHKEITQYKKAHRYTHTPLLFVEAQIVPVEVCELVGMVGDLHTRRGTLVVACWRVLRERLDWEWGGKRERHRVGVGWVERESEK
jgi:hypothetical protein